MTARYRRIDWVSETVIDDDLFLVVPANEGLYHLNAIGAALWRYLAAPRQRDDILETLTAAFDAEPPDALRQDIDRFLGDLTAHGLVVSSSAQ